MPELFPTDFTIESNLALPVDAFEARYPGAAVFLARSADTTVTLAPSHRDDVGLPRVSAHIELRAWSGAGEYEVQISAPPIPWLRRSSSLRLTGVVAEDGTAIPESGMLIESAPSTGS